MTNLDSIFKSRDITLPTKVCLAKAMVFPVVMYGCESWTVKKAECRRIDAFELWCWTRLLRVPWTARRSNQSILKGISPGCSLEGMMLKLKLQYVGHLMRRVDSLEKTLMLGGIGGRRRRGRQRMRWHHWFDEREFEWTPGVGDGQGGLACCNAWGRKESDTTEWLKWTELNKCSTHILFSLFPVFYIFTQLKWSFCIKYFSNWRVLIHRRRQWQPTPVLLPGESHGQRCLVGCGPWGREESDRTERLHFHFSLSCIGEGMATHSSVLAGESQGRGSLVGCRLWGRTESDTTEVT